MSKNYYDDASYQESMQKNESALLAVPGVAALGDLLFRPTSPLLLLSGSAVVSVLLGRAGPHFVDHLLVSRPLAGFGIGYWIGKSFGASPTTHVLYAVIGALVFQLNALQALQRLVGYGGKRYNPVGKDTAQPAL